MSEDLKQRLDPVTYHVTQEYGTEPPFSGQYWNEHADGTYHCKVCGAKLFESDAKFDSGTGWPSFDQAVPDSVKLELDESHGMHRTMVICSQCGAHLGHIFDDLEFFPNKKSQSSDKQRFCINSCALDLKKSN